MARISITLLSDERDALITLSERERRTMRDQAALLLRERLIERGLLPSDQLDNAPTAPTPQAVQP